MVKIGVTSKRYKKRAVFLYPFQVEGVLQYTCRGNPMKKNERRTSMNKDEVKQLGNRMLHYFRSECKGADGKEILPSFVRFAAMEETSIHQLRELREKNAAFAKIAEECEEILCDRIAEGALYKRLDGSFAKFLLSIISFI